jgi:hypothetical protein
MADYQTTEPNAAIPLYNGPITLQDGRGSVTGEGTIELRWLPDLEIGFSIPDVPLMSSGGPCMGLGKSDLRLAVPDAIWAVPIVMTSQRMGSHCPHSVHGVFNGPLQIGQNVPLAAVELCLANFAYFLPPHMYTEGNRGIRIDPIHWEIDGWVITIAAMPGLAQLVEKVKAAGGYALTHRVRVERIGAATFSVDEVEALTDRLFWFLCFAQGRCVNLILPVGYDADGKVVWQKWAPWRVSRWKWSESWVDEQHAHRIVDAFKGFIQRCQNPAWKETTDLVLYWFVESNLSFSLNTSIVLAQIAMERLAWEHFVRQGGMSKKHYKDMGNAAARIAALAGALSIPVQIPPHCPEMLGLSRPNLISAIATVRNDIAHPEPRVSPNPRLLLEARNCSVWLLEMLLLRLFDYHGPYSDRREPDKWVGLVSPVPWMKQP